MDAIVLAAGTGSRTNLNYPKQFFKINGKPILIYSLETLSKSSSIEKIILTCNMDYLDQYKRYINDYGINNVRYIEGGKTRQESVLLGLKHVSTTRLLLHEAARPLISNDFIDYLIGFKNEDAVIPTIPIKFTVAIGKDYMENELDRSILKNVQLPQVFKTDILKEAHLKAVEDKYYTTEDGTLVFHYGAKVRFVEGRESNIKITTNLDIELVNNLLKFND